MCQCNTFPTTPSFVAAAVPCTDKIIKNGLNVERGERLLQNGIQYCTLCLGLVNRQKSR